MKLFAGIISLLILIFSLASCGTQQKEQSAPPPVSTHPQPVPDLAAVLDTKMRMLQEPIMQGEHLCMNLSAAEIKGMGWPPITPEIKSEETCNYQHNQITNILQQAYVHQSVDINYYEYPPAVHNVLIRNITPAEYASKNNSVTQEHYDVIHVNTFSVIRDFLENIAPSFMKVGSTSKYISCSLYTRIPTGLIQIIQNYEIESPYTPINLSVDTEPACAQAVIVLKILLTYHAQKDVTSPLFCLDIEDHWLFEHQLKKYAYNDVSHDGSGCQDQTLTWTNLSPGEQQNEENSITLQIVHGLYSSNEYHAVVIGGRDAQIWASSFEDGDINTSRTAIIHVPLTQDRMLVVKVNSQNLIPQQVSRLANQLAFYELSHNITY